MKKVQNSLYQMENLSKERTLATLVSELSGEKDTEVVNGFIHGVGIEVLEELTLADIKNFGFKPAAAKRLLSSVQLMQKVNRLRVNRRYRISSPESAAQFIKDDLQYKGQEHFVVTCLNRKNEVIHTETVFKGSISYCVLDPSKVFQLALKYGAASIVCFHNHPSGSPDPSDEDKDVTKRLVEVGQLIGIHVVDHIIIGAGGRYVSLKEKGYIA